MVTVYRKYCFILCYIIMHDCLGNNIVHHAPSYVRTVDLRGLHLLLGKTFLFIGLHFASKNFKVPRLEKIKIEFYVIFVILDKSQKKTFPKVPGTRKMDSFGGGGFIVSVVIWFFFFFFFFFFDFPKSKCGGKCNPSNKKRKALLSIIVLSYWCNERATLHEIVRSVMLMLKYSSIC